MDKTRLLCLCAYLVSMSFLLRQFGKLYIDDAHQVLLPTTKTILPGDKMATYKKAALHNAKHLENNSIDVPISRKTQRQHYDISVSRERQRVWNLTLLAQRAHYEHFQYSRKVARARTVQTQILTALPGVILFGVQKCGTEAVGSFLKMHPNISSHLPWETDFFCTHYHKGLKWYRSLMPNTAGGKLVIEGSPNYFVDPETPERIYSMNNSIKLLLVVRDPVRRLISDYNHIKINKFRYVKKFSSQKNHTTATGLIDKRYKDDLVWRRHYKIDHSLVPFEKEVIHEATGEVNFFFKPVLEGIYSHYFRRWLEYFPVKQIHIIDGDQMVENPVSELRKIERFLGINEHFNENHFRFVPSKGYYCKVVSGTARCLSYFKGHHPLKVHEAVRQKLRLFYKPYNMEFFKMTKRHFKWNC